MISTYNQFNAPAQSGAGGSQWGGASTPPAWGVTGPELGAYYARQAAYASSGSGLASIDAEQHPADELTGAANTAGAYWRVAYWLATGVRLLTTRGASFGIRQQLMAKAAIANASAAGRLSMAYSPLTWLWSGNESPADIQAVFEDGARTAEGYGLSDVAQRLRSLGTASKTQQQQAATAGQQPLSDLPSNITHGAFRSWRSPRNIAIVAALLALIVAYKYRAPIGRALSTGAKAAALAL
jgi:hypothetical protein